MAWIGWNHTEVHLTGAFIIFEIFCCKHRDFARAQLKCFSRTRFSRKFVKCFHSSKWSKDGLDFRLRFTTASLHYRHPGKVLSAYSRVDSTFQPNYPQTAVGGSGCFCFFVFIAGSCVCVCSLSNRGNVSSRSQTCHSSRLEYNSWRNLCRQHWQVKTFWSPSCRWTYVLVSEARVARSRNPYIHNDSSDHLVCSRYRVRYQRYFLSWRFERDLVDNDRS